jgi:hypothetical protein
MMTSPSDRIETYNPWNMVLIVAVLVISVILYRTCPGFAQVVDILL